MLFSWSDYNLSLLYTFLDAAQNKEDEHSNRVVNLTSVKKRRASFNWHRYRVDCLGQRGHIEWGFALASRAHNGINKHQLLLSPRSLASHTTTQRSLTTFTSKVINSYTSFTGTVMKHALFLLHASGATSPAHPSRSKYLYLTRKSCTYLHFYHLCASELCLPIPLLLKEGYTISRSSSMSTLSVLKDWQLIFFIAFAVVADSNLAVVDFDIL